MEAASGLDGPGLLSLTLTINQVALPGFPHDYSCFRLNDITGGGADS